MQRVLTAPRAIFLHLKSIRVVRLVLLRGVVATLALGAREGNQCTHESSQLNGRRRNLLDGDAMNDNTSLFRGMSRVRLVTPLS